LKTRDEGWNLRKTPKNLNTRTNKRLDGIDPFREDESKSCSLIFSFSRPVAHSVLLVAMSGTTINPSTKEKENV